MRWGGLWVLMLVGCPWIGIDDHRRNHAELTQPAPDDTVGDADTDSDSDTDSDTDADTDTDVLCVDDAFEPNNTVLTATEVSSFPASLDGTMCPEDLSATFGIPLDLYEIEVGPDEVLVADLQTVGDAPCNQQTLGLKITDELAHVFDGAEDVGRCPSLSTGWGSGRYYVWVYDEVDAPSQPYDLQLDLTPCQDLDGDGFLADTCGGPDCADLQADRYPGATDLPVDGIDQDCDGGDDLASTCGVVTVGANATVGELRCGLLETGAVWDQWTVPVAAGTELSVVAQNDAVGAADLVALIVDPDGTTHYGLQSDRSQMDDEGDCESAAWTGALTACPAACVEPTVAGAATIWIAQWPGAGCHPFASYRLLVYENGTPSTPTLVENDIDLAFPP